MNTFFLQFGAYNLARHTRTQCNVVVYHVWWLFVTFSVSTQKQSYICRFELSRPSGAWLFWFVVVWEALPFESLLLLLSPCPSVLLQTVNGVVV